MKSKLIIVLAVILIILAAALIYKKYRVAPEIKTDLLSLTDLQGNAVSLNSFAGKKLFIHFFATWCGPCMQELPSLVKSQSILGKENFRFIFISDEPVVRLQSFKEQTGMQIMILHSEKSLQENQIVTLPTSYVLNIRQEVVFAKVGTADWASESMIEKLKGISN